MAPGPPFAAVCFDCDSTLTTLEGIDEIAARAGRAAEIVPLTTAAMDGLIPLDQVYARRLELIKPDRDTLAWCGQRYIETVVSGTVETIARLQRIGKSVHVISGGLRQPVAMLADYLGIVDENVHAVAVDLDSGGAYRGFDERSPLARAGGKAQVCAALVARYGSVAMVGDGNTDLEARIGGAFVVGFGGVVMRPAVFAGADVFIPGPALTDTLSALLTATERAEIDLKL